VNDQVEQKNSHEQGNPAGGGAENGKPAGERSKFNWVTGRFQCSLAAVFRELRLEVEEDVKTRNSLRLPNSAYEFSVADGEAAFTVTLKAKEIQKSVLFKLAEHAILVRDDQGNSKFDVTLVYSDDGKCRLRVNQDEREYWQVRRMALEDLMFASY
jgi:hypothetical protein